MNEVRCYNCQKETTDAVQCTACRYYYCKDCVSPTSILCGNCMEEDREVTLNLQYGTGKGSIIKTNRLVGLEIEAEGGRREQVITQLDPLCGYCGDGSLGYRGLEVQTPPSSLNFLENIITHTMRQMKKSGYVVRDSCGMHVHIDFKDHRDDPRKIVQVFKTFYAVEPIIYAMLPVSRVGNRYCKPLSTVFKFSDFFLGMSDTDLSEKWYMTVSQDNITNWKRSKSGVNRYCGCNLHSIYFRGTIEFRYFGGTLEPEKAFNWIQTLLELVTYATESFEEEVITAINNEQDFRVKKAKMLEMIELSSGVQKYIKERVAKFIIPSTLNQLSQVALRRSAIGNIPF